MVRREERDPFVPPRWAGALDTCFCAARGRTCSRDRFVPGPAAACEVRAPGHRLRRTPLQPHLPKLECGRQSPCSNLLGQRPVQVNAGPAPGTSGLLGRAPPLIEPRSDVYTSDWTVSQGPRLWRPGLASVPLSAPECSLGTAPLASN